MTTLACRMLGGVVLAIFASVAAPVAGQTQQPAAPPAKAEAGPKARSKAKSVPTLDAEALKIPDNIHQTQARRIEKPEKTLPSPSLPNKFDLGAYDLAFSASHSKDVVPRTGLDSGEKSNLSNSAFGRKTDSALPNYFGLKLSAPVNSGNILALVPSP